MSPPRKRAPLIDNKVRMSQMSEREFEEGEKGGCCRLKVWLHHSQLDPRSRDPSSLLYAGTCRTTCTVHNTTYNLDIRVDMYMRRHDVLIAREYMHDTRADGQLVRVHLSDDTEMHLKRQSRPRSIFMWTSM